MTTSNLRKLKWGSLNSFGIGKLVLGFDYEWKNGAEKQQVATEAQRVA